jgi:hypothetical protein
MIRSPRTHWLLVLGFLLGQTLALVHATGHEVMSGNASPSCASCAVAHSPGAAPDAITSADVPYLAGTAPALVRDEPFSPPAALYPPSRGPPTLLA